MKALVFTHEQELVLAEVPKPKITDAHEVLIKVKATGICGTDIHILKKEYYAKPGTILGHESAGIVEAVGAQVKNVRPGDRVILDPTYHCGVCFYCQNNRPNYCIEKSHTETGVSSNGTYATYHVAHDSFLHPLPQGMSFEEGTLAEPLACVLNALRQTRIVPESRVLILGAGPIGLLFGLATTSMGCEVTIGDISEYRIQQARELFTNVQEYHNEGPSKVNKDRRFDIVVDTSGKLLEEVLTLVDRGGDLVMAGLDYSFEAKIKPSYLTDNGIRIVGSIDTNLTFEPAIKMIRTNKNFKKLITHEFSLHEYKKAFSALGLNLKTGERGAIHEVKVVLHPA